ncbi:MAG TPA: maltose alpha-D-glucosyltransferase [Alphaproteobacteria bacterium]|nr:maltose alpha-D-glucosyltransferase [Alphaproteobacteria bacterium]
MAARSHLDPIDRSDRLWFKDAIIYELHVKAFYDANGDGIGDFAGLTQKLDYLRDLGVTALWLLPFYPSPLRDDGYDISDYRGIHPSYGSMRDFRHFVRACHERGLRVITELVVNHTSDQHHWFQRARAAKPNSVYRNYYVWSDTDQKYAGTRIIFLDTEKSNWAWDPVAKAYYWHRFYSHQPELNFDNPRVIREVMGVLNHWLSIGVDGMRLDAVPYLIEREGTSNESLPETHEVLKRIRAELDGKYPDRMLLAEANQWPEDVLPYFGNGDECHMAFHFPLMPRMYMAIAQEDRHPITDIMRQTPDIPETCQWAIFLRNHDELTLEMVTDRERDYLWDYFASDRRMRINLGIRRRLAPLMENDRRRIELMNGLLLSLPGTPVLYYGDEIGMGDNVFLGDRDGVRTPMQWSPDRNGGFSRADPARLYLPPIMDPIYGYGAINVEAQLRSTSSLLSWTRRMLATRQTQRVFGRGSLQFLYPGNRKILAFLRAHEDRTALCVFNLGRSPQAVELDLSRYKGRVPVELTGPSAFPPIGELPYLLTLPAYGFHWFLLANEAQLPSWHQPIPEPAPEFVTLVVREGWRDLLKAPMRNQLETAALPGFLARQRWFGAKDERINAAAIDSVAELKQDDRIFLLMQIAITLASGDTQRYFVPLALSKDAETSSAATPLVSVTVAQVRRGPQMQSLYDAVASREFPLLLIQLVGDGRELDAESGRIRFTPTAQMSPPPQLPPDAEIRRLGVEQSNSSVLIGDQFVLKLYRRVAAGAHPELEMCRFLTEAGYQNTPPLMGAMEHIAADGMPTALGVIHGFVRNQGNGWDHALSYLGSKLEEHGLGVTAEPANGANLATHQAYLELIATLGQRVAEMHAVLAKRTGDAAFDPEPVTAKDLREWRAAARKMAERGFASLKQVLPKLSGDLKGEAIQLYRRRKDCLALVDALVGSAVSAEKTRIHGDLHLGQVLLTQTDWQIIDFEGEPAKPVEERRRKHSPLRDVAGMLRSFDYVARSVVARVTTITSSPVESLSKYAIAWRDAAAGAFLSAYRGRAAGIASYPREEAETQRLLDLFMLEKACYELNYEAANRPAWISIPISGAAAILDAHGVARP